MALQRVVDRYGAYITHIAALIEDTSLKSDDRARLKGYVKKWKKARILIGVAMVYWCSFYLLALDYNLFI